MTEPTGILIINKHTGVTSHDIVGSIRRLYGTRRVGHTGTLDPLASGVLVVLIGRAAKAAEYLTADSKEYAARLRLGIATDTQDITGTVLRQSDQIPSFSQVQEVVSSFVGNISQIPPMYSALKRDGQKLCDLARKGITVERQSRPVVIHRLTCRATERKDEYCLAVACSSGTYIRTLCADIGEALACGGVMTELERRKTGHFSLEQSYTVSQLEAMTEAERLSCLLPAESLFDSLPAVLLSEFFERLCRNGCELYQKKLGVSHEVGQRLRLCTASGHFFALGEVRDYPNGTAIKAIKQFDLS